MEVPNQSGTASSRTPYTATANRWWAAGNLDQWLKTETSQARSIQLDREIALPAELAQLKCELGELKTRPSPKDTKNSLNIFVVK